MIEKEFDEILEDIDSANDDFVNNYFSDESDIFDMQKDLKEEEDLNNENNESSEQLNNENNESSEQTNSENEEIDNSFDSWDDELDKEIQKAQENKDVVETENDEKDNEVTDNDELTENINEEANQKEYQNHFTSFSKTNLNKISTKKIKVYHENNFTDKETEEEPVKDEKKFSYSEILDRLDKDRRYDLNNVSDLMKFIDKCKTSEEFFNYVESEMNDKHKLG